MSFKSKSEVHITIKALFCYFHDSVTLTGGAYGLFPSYLIDAPVIHDTRLAGKETDIESVFKLTATGHEEDN